MKLIILLLLSLLNQGHLQAKEIEVHQGQPSPIAGVLIDFDSYRKIVSSDRFNTQMTDAYLQLQHNCTLEPADSLSTDTAQILTGFLVGVITMGIIK